MNHKQERQIKRDGMMFFGENIINFLLKLFIGAIMFWILYYPIFNLNQSNFDILSQMSYIMLFSTMASITALILSFFIICIILRISGRPKKGYTDLNSLFDFDKWVYEMVAVMINAILIATGLMSYLSDIAMNWVQFLLLFILYKFLARVGAYLIKQLIGKNILVELMFLVAFFAILLISIMNIAGGFLFETS